MTQLSVGMSGNYCKELTKKIIVMVRVANVCNDIFFMSLGNEIESNYRFKKFNESNDVK